MDVKYEILEEFEDPYMKTPCGKGYFLSGIVVGQVASQQVEGNDIASSPLFKTLQMGRLDKRSLRKVLSRLPQLMTAYGVKNPGRLNELLSKAMEFLAMCKEDMGVDGNYYFTMGFVGTYKWYKKLFPRTDDEFTLEDTDTEVENTAENTLPGIER